jgi:Mycothiol maleylpyruvate isomerase N-terminal domain
MPTLLSLDDHLEALARSGTALREAAAAAGLDARVPTCPAWDVTKLVIHQGMVHRWAAANLRGERGHSVDAISAMCRRWPTASDVEVDPVLAADGIDELLMGFITRDKGRLHAAEPYQLLVRTSDTGHAWTLRISDGPIVTTPGATERPEDGWQTAGHAAPAGDHRCSADGSGPCSRTPASSVEGPGLSPEK